MDAANDEAGGSASPMRRSNSAWPRRIGVHNCGERRETKRRGCAEGGRSQAQARRYALQHNNAIRSGPVARWTVVFVY